MNSPTPIPRSAETGPSARERLLEVAEYQFAFHGYRGASLRAITKEAGVALGSVGHHFGGKRELFAAVYDRLDKTEARIQALEKLLAANPNPPLEDLFDAAFETTVRHFRHPQGPQRALFALRGIFEHDIFWPLVEKTSKRVGDRFVEAFCRALPDVPREEVSLRWRSAIQVVVMGLTPSTQHRYDPAPIEDAQVEAYLRQAFLILGQRLPERRPAFLEERADP